MQVYLPIAEMSVDALLLLGIGGGVGFLSGLFGVGGGFLLTPILILIGANDDWTPMPPCRTLASRFPERITLQVYPDAWHDFDAPDRPMRTRTGLASTPGGTGVAHTGTNEAARQDALRCVPAFIDAP